MTETKKLPAFQFYTGDWLKDPALSMCSPASRGVWIDLLSAMHELERSGQITGTPEQLSRICRCTAAEFGHALDELIATKTADVTFRNGFVTVTNRRMKRESNSRKSANERVKRHRSTKKASDDTDVKRECNNTSSSSSSSSVSCNTHNSVTSNQTSSPEGGGVFARERAHARTRGPNHPPHPEAVDFEPYPKSEDDPELVGFFTDNGSDEATARKFFLIFNSKGWVQSNQQPILSWRSRAKLFIDEETHNPGKYNSAKGFSQVQPERLVVPGFDP